MNTFQGVERLIYEYILNHASQLKTIPAKQIAARTHSNTTSVNRVCKKMGYASYTEARFMLGNDAQAASSGAGALQVGQALQCDLEKIVQAITSHNLIYLYGRGASINSLNYLSRFLSIANIPSLTVVDVHQLAKAQEGLMLLISKSGETQSVVQMAHTAKSKQLYVASISPQNSSLGLSSNLNIDLGEKVGKLSLYDRESQLKTLIAIDELGRLLLNRH